MKKNFTYIKSTLLLILTFVIFAVVTQKNKQRKIEHITINLGEHPTQLIEKSAIRKLLKQNGKDIVNQPKSLVNLQRLEKSVLQHPLVKSAEISMGVLGDVEVTIEQKNPIARVVQGDFSFYLDEQAQPMPLSTIGSCKVILLDNDNRRLNYKKVYPLIVKIKNDNYFNDFITGIKKSKTGYVLTTRIKEHEILFGSLYRMNEKIKKAKAFYNYALKNRLVSKYKIINLQYHNQVVCLK